MNSKVVIVADATTGAVIYPSANNPEWGYVRLQQVRTVIDDNGFLRRQTLGSLVQAPVSILKEMGYYAGQILDGKIVIKESLTPFNTKNPDRDLKIAGKTGIVCTFEGQPIYRKTMYNSAGTASDTTIQHDNVEELRNAYNAQLANSSAMKPSNDFTL